MSKKQVKILINFLESKDFLENIKPNLTKQGLINFIYDYIYYLPE